MMRMGNSEKKRVPRFVRYDSREYGQFGVQILGVLGIANNTTYISRC